MKAVVFKEGKDTVVGIGSALIDILTYVDDTFLEKTGAVKGGMILVDHVFIEKTLAGIAQQPAIVPGGSACNTIVGIGKLGGKARFVGKCGQGEMGNFFEKALMQNHVTPVLIRSSTPTGRVLSLITPDAQRSMFTFLGAASEMQPGELLQCEFQDAAIVHLEGYLVFNKALIFSALEQAKKAGALVSLDLASFTVVEESKEILTELIERYVDILIANEDEATVFTGHRDEKKAIETLSKSADIAVLKIGKGGSYIASSGKIIKVAPLGDGSAVDTTGAGDLWAAGFLFGLINGYSLEKCGLLGSACGYEVCQGVGAAISEAGWARIKGLLKAGEE
jgi:sugar/nucleoside kinase (ribokinase family)